MPKNVEGEAPEVIEVAMEFRGSKQSLELTEALKNRISMEFSSKHMVENMLKSKTGGFVQMIILFHFGVGTSGVFSFFAFCALRF